MNLRVFNPEPDLQTASSKQPRISLNAYTGRITISPAALEKFKLKTGGLINFAEDEDQPGDWYLLIDPAPPGLKLFELKTNIRPNSPSTVVKSKRLVTDMLLSLDKKGQNICIPLGELMLVNSVPVVPLITRNWYPAKPAKKCTPANVSTN